MTDCQLRSSHCLPGTGRTRTVSNSHKHGPGKVISPFFNHNGRTKLWSKLAPLRAISLSIISLVETPSKPNTTPKSKPKKDDDESLPPTYIAAISMVLTSSPLTPSPFDQTVFLTHSDKDIHPLSVSSTIH